MKPLVLQYSPTDWAEKASRQIQRALDLSRQSGSIRTAVVLTGGRSARELYLSWAKQRSFRQIRQTDFYFGDERIVPYDHAESNYGMVMETLFANGVPETCAVHPMPIEDGGSEASLQAYASQLPSKVDVAIFSVGEDGHIASLFPKSQVLENFDQKVVKVSAPMRPAQRITITPKVICSAEYVFVLAIGGVKRSILDAAEKSPSDVKTIPARLVLERTWITTH